MLQISLFQIYYPILFLNLDNYFKGVKIFRKYILISAEKNGATEKYLSRKNLKKGLFLLDSNKRIVKFVIKFSSKERNFESYKAVEIQKSQKGVKLHSEKSQKGVKSACEKSQKGVNLHSEKSQKGARL